MIRLHASVISSDYFRSKRWILLYQNLQLHANMHAIVLFQGIYLCCPRTLSSPDVRRNLPPLSAHIRKQDDHELGNFLTRQKSI
ncbi:hypothetical protein C0J52_25008 [Blattella germanica]|nr:hypothetical protein C0J52_25008 [Blattella germanica]